MNFLNDSCNISFVRDSAKIQRKTKGKGIFISSILSFLSTDWPTTRTTPDKNKKRERMTVSRDKFNNKKIFLYFCTYHFGLGIQYYWFKEKCKKSSW